MRAGGFLLLGCETGLPVRFCPSAGGFFLGSVLVEVCHGGFLLSRGSGHREVVIICCYLPLYVARFLCRLGGSPWGCLCLP